MGNRYQRESRPNRHSRPISWDEAVSQSTSPSRYVPSFEEAAAALEVRQGQTLMPGLFMEALAQFILTQHQTPVVPAGEESPSLYAQHQITAAERLARGWHELMQTSQYRLSESDVRSWIRLSPQVTPLRARQLLDAGLAFDDVVLKAWYGQVHPHRERLIDRYCRGDLTVGEVLDEVRKVRDRQAQEHSG